MRKPHGGVWELQINSARVILSALLKQHGTSLNEESLITLLAEVESIIDSRPLTVETLADIGSEAPFSPINLLIMKSKVVLPPPEGFKQPDLYSRPRWRRVQHIAEECWCRWQKEILVILQNIKSCSDGVVFQNAVCEEYFSIRLWCCHL